MSKSSASTKVARIKKLLSYQHRDRITRSRFIRQRISGGRDIEYTVGDAQNTMKEKTVMKYYTSEMAGSGQRGICENCKKGPTKEGHDGCLGTLPGPIMNACCGHGRDSIAYIQYWGGKIITGTEAIAEQQRLRDGLISTTQGKMMTAYKSMDDAPHDGTTIIGLVNGEECELEWHERRY